MTVKLGMIVQLDQTEFNQFNGNIMLNRPLVLEAMFYIDWSSFCSCFLFSSKLPISVFILLNIKNVGKHFKGSMKRLNCVKKSKRAQMWNSNLSLTRTVGKLEKLGRLTNFWPKKSQTFPLVQKQIYLMDQIFYFKLSEEQSGLRSIVLAILYGWGWGPIVSVYIRIFALLLPPSFSLRHSFSQDCN